MKAPGAEQSAPSRLSTRPPSSAHFALCVGHFCTTPGIVLRSAGSWAKRRLLTSLHPRTPLLIVVTCLALVAGIAPVRLHRPQPRQPFFDCRRRCRTDLFRCVTMEDTRHQTTDRRFLAVTSLAASAAIPLVLVAPVKREAAAASALLPPSAVAVRMLPLSFQRIGMTDQRCRRQATCDRAHGRCGRGK